MPNWCYNNLTIIGEKRILNKFKKQARYEHINKTANEAVVDPFSFNNFLPIPDEFKSLHPNDLDDWDMSKKWDITCCDDWTEENWGIRGETSDSCLKKCKGRLHYFFYSPWKTPLKGIVRISSQYPSLKFKLVFDDEGFEYCGKIVFFDGKIISKVVNICGPQCTHCLFYRNEYLN